MKNLKALMMAMGIALVPLSAQAGVNLNINTGLHVACDVAAESVKDKPFWTLVGASCAFKQLAGLDLSTYPVTYRSGGPAIGAAACALGALGFAYNAACECYENARGDFEVVRTRDFKDNICEGIYQGCTPLSSSVISLISGYAGIMALHYALKLIS